MKYIPHGMWPRLISRILGDKQMKESVAKQLANTTEGNLNWYAWKKGVELHWNNQPILRLQEATGSIFSSPRLDPSLVHMTVCHQFDMFNDIDVIQSSHDVGLQLWIANDPVKTCELSSHDKLEDERADEAETVKTESPLPGRRYSMKEVDKGFTVIEFDPGYKTSVELRHEMSPTLSVKTKTSHDADRQRHESFVNSVSSYLPPESRPEPLAVKLLTRCASHIDTILQDWYHGLRDYNTFSLCRDCLRSALLHSETANVANSRSVHVCVFTLDAAVRQAYCTDTIACRQHENVPLAWIVPDAVTNQDTFH